MLDKLNHLPKWTWERLTPWLTHRRLALHLALIAIVLSSSALWLGFYLDDYVGRYIYSDREGAARLFENYSGGYGLAIGDPAENHWQREAGWAPWWHYEQLRLALYRPIGVLSHTIDFRLWPDNATVMHAHNLLWLGLLVVAMTWMYRGVLGGLVGGAAALLFAFDHTHGFAVGHICNRHALLGPLFGALCIGAHVRARSDAKRLLGAQRGPARLLVLGPLFYVVGLLTSESAIAVAAYVIAYELFASEDTWKRRALSAAPYLLITMVWRALYNKAGYGAFGSGVYIDLGRQPVQYARAFLERAPVLWTGQFLTPPAELYGMLQDPVDTLLFLWALSVLVCSLWTLAPLLVRDRMARFWFVGMLGSLIPAAAVLPHDRQLVFVSIGAMALLAQIFQRYASDPSAFSGLTLRLGMYYGMLLLFAHLVASPLALPATTASIALTTPLHRALDTVRDDAAGRDLIFVTTPDYYTVRLVQLKLRIEGRPLPARIRALSGVPSGAPLPIPVKRTGERTLVLHFEGGLFSPPNSDLHRDRSLPTPSDVRLSGLAVRVLTTTPEGWPIDVEYTFERPLEDPSLVFYQWKDAGFTRFAVPAIGEQVELPGAALPTI